MQIKTTMRYHLMAVRMWPSLKHLQIINAGEGMEKREPSYSVGENVNLYRHYGECYVVSSKKLKLQLPHDPTIRLLSIDYTSKTYNKPLYS